MEQPMTSTQHEPALHPEDLGRYFVERANRGDAAGLVALYEPDAVLALPSGQLARGHAEILAAYRQLLASRPQFRAGEPRPTLISGELALTSTRLESGAVTAEVARRQPDGTWLWIIDDPNVVG
jgi:ketosteroid isomerase-like protein